MGAGAFALLTTLRTDCLVRFIPVAKLETPAPRTLVPYPTCVSYVKTSSEEDECWRICVTPGTPTFDLVSLIEPAQRVPYPPRCPVGCDDVGNSWVEFLILHKCSVARRFRVWEKKASTASGTGENMAAHPRKSRRARHPLFGFVSENDKRLGMQYKRAPFESSLQ